MENVPTFEAIKWAPATNGGGVVSLLLLLTTVQVLSSQGAHSTSGNKMCPGTRRLLFCSQNSFPSDCEFLVISGTWLSN